MREGRGQRLRGEGGWGYKAAYERDILPCNFFLMPYFCCFVMTGPVWLAAVPSAQSHTAEPLAGWHLGMGIISREQTRILTGFMCTRREQWLPCALLGPVLCLDITLSVSLHKA